LKGRILKKTIIGFYAFFLFNSIVFAWTPLPDSISFFPLAPGSYWVYRDSVYNPADAEDIGTSTLTKDSIISRTVCDSGIIVNWVNITTADGKRKVPDKWQYFCDTNGFVYEKYIKKNKLIQLSKPSYKVNPSPGDTCIFENDTIAYYKNSKNNWLYNERLDKKMKSKYDLIYKSFFAKGIGFIGSPGTGFSTNLIEYRIGNGPIVKKHWLMEAPEKK
jgi:hypothetical protein